MSLLDDVSIVVTPNGYKAGELYAVIPVPTEGAEEIVDSSFANDLDDWSKYGVTSATGGVATIGASANSGIFQGILTEGVRYTVTVNVISYNGVGTAQFVNANGSNIYTITETGIHTFIFTHNYALSELIIRGLSNALFSLSSVSVKEVTSSDMDVTRATAATRVDENGLVNYAEVIGDEEITDGDFPTGTTNWTIEDVWTISGNSANGNGANGSSQQLVQSSVFTIGKTYKVTYDIINYVSGSVFMPNVGSSNSGDQTYSEYITATQSDFKITGINFYGSITNISVKEVTRDNVPRIDYTGGGCPHILAEPQRTNLIKYSESFDSWYAKNYVTVAENTSETISPSGNNTASKITINSVSTVRRLYELISASSGSDYTFTLYAKKGTTDFIKLFFTSSIIDAEFNLTNGTVTSGTGSIESVGNDWYRLQATGTSSLTGEVPQIQLSSSASVSDYLYIWGCQVEQSSYETSYIPTSGSTVTRNQDIFTRDGIGSLINSTEGVLFVELENITGTDATNKMISITDGSLTNKISLFVSSNQISVESAGSGTNLGIYSKALQSGFNKIAVKFKVNDCALWVNGTEYTDTSFAAFSSSTFNSLVFDRGDGIQNLFGKVKQLQVYNTALTDEQLLQLTGTSGTDFYESYAEMASALTYTIQ